jgi:hypothetical protein
MVAQLAIVMLVPSVTFPRASGGFLTVDANVVIKAVVSGCNRVRPEGALFGKWCNNIVA